MYVVAEDFLVLLLDGFGHWFLANLKKGNFAGDISTGRWSKSHPARIAFRMFANS